MACIMHQQGLGCIQATPLVSPHSCNLASAVRAYMCPQSPGALIHGRRLAHVFIYGLPCPVPLPVQAVLPHPHPASLGKHPLPQLGRQVYAMQLPGL